MLHNLYLFVSRLENAPSHTETARPSSWPFRHSTTRCTRAIPSVLRPALSSPTWRRSLQSRQAAAAAQEDVEDRAEVAVVAASEAGTVEVLGAVVVAEAEVTEVERTVVTAGETTIVTAEETLVAVITVAAEVVMAAAEVVMAVVVAAAAIVAEEVVTAAQAVVMAVQEVVVMTVQKAAAAIAAQAVVMAVQEVAVTAVQEAVMAVPG